MDATISRWFFYIVIFVGLLYVSVYSFYRFFVEKNYIVEYAIPCNTSEHSCYVRCTEEDCKTYALMRRIASDIYGVCGASIVNCSYAQSCDTTKNLCTISYCDSVLNGEITCLRDTGNVQANSL